MHDKNALAWAHAWIGHQAPPQDKIGFMYMLAGGTDASNTDPYAQQPTAENNWIKTGPHVMSLGPQPAHDGRISAGSKARHDPALCDVAGHTV